MVPSIFTGVSRNSGGSVCASNSGTAIEAIISMARQIERGALSFMGVTNVHQAM